MSAVLASTQTIGRFELIRELGRGAQGTVHLARDPHLDRLVAIKALRLSGDTKDRAQRMSLLMQEARLVSKLHHPNIVTLFDAVEHQGAPCLVFEYVEGRPLSDVVVASERLPATQIVDIAIGILRGISFAHGKKVLHRDIKPANVMLTAAGTPRVMDFGIACEASAAPLSEKVLCGTPAYMAPEYVSEQRFLPASDLYAAGVLLYELLTGTQPISGTNVYELLYRITSGEFPPPSQRNPDVDERLDMLVMRALARTPEKRFASADKMAEALADYLAPPPEAGSGSGAGGGTLEFLLRRIRQRSDFPTFSETIGGINRAAASEREPTSVLCNLILKDVALTSKLLKVVNAACFAQFGGSISTVSRAIAVLGYDEVRRIATSLLLFDHLQNKAQASALQDEAMATYFSGTLARQLVRGLGIRDAEEAFICAMFHRLGRLLVTFYLHEDKQAIDGLAQSRGWDEVRAAREVLGLGYEDIGVGVARQWNFPPAILESMAPLPEETVSPAAFQSDRLRVLADLANRLCDVVRFVPEGERAGRLNELVVQFGPATGIDTRLLGSVVTRSVEQVRDDVGPGHALVRKSRVMERAHGWEEGTDHDTHQTRAAGSPETGTLTGNLLADTQLVDPALASLVESPPPRAIPAPGQRQAALTAGVQDITNTLVGSYALNDVLRIIMETMYRAMGFTRVLLLVRDPRQNSLRARFGLGPGTEDLIHAGFSVPLSQGRDIFYAALGKGADVCVEDIDAANIREYVPPWYRSAISTRGLVLFPVRVGEKAIALIYCDAEEPSILQFSSEELNLLKTLRNQAVLAVKQKN